MGAQQLPLVAVYLLGVLTVTSCLGGLSRKDSEIQMRLSNSNSRCQGQLEVYNWGLWYSVCSQSWDGSWSFHKDPTPPVKGFCQQLHCGDALELAIFSYFGSARNQMLCHGTPGSFSNCSRIVARQCQPLSLICVEPSTTRPPPTSPTTTTTPEPTAPPRLQLRVGPAGLRCAGLVEFYHGSQGGAISDEAQNLTQGLGDLICTALQCGNFLRRLPDSKESEGPQWEQRPPLMRWKIQNTSCISLEECFGKIQPRKGSQALALVCSGFQPKVQSRLVGGHSTCEGTVEVRQVGQWVSLCSNNPAKNLAQWEEVCQEQQCGSVKAYRELDAGEKMAQGLICPKEKLSQCHELQDRKNHCKRVFVTCQNHHPLGLGAGTVVSIILALVLLAVLLVVCGPLVYKKLVKKFRQKQQRQWIGPTGMNQNMSFHRNHTVTVRPQVENPTVSHVDNEYSQPPRNSHASSYPALEGVLHRSSAQPDNSSDSDYDLHGAQRL